MPKTAGRTRRPVPPSATLSALGERLRKARIEAGLSQAQLGAPHFTRAHLSAIEMGKVRPAVRALEFLAGKLGKPAGYFLEDEAEAQKRKARESDIAQANQLISSGQLDEAVALLEPLLESVESPADRATLQRSLARARIQTGAGASAAALLGEALAFYARSGDIENELRTRAQLAAALQVMGSYGEAAEHLDLVLRGFVRGDLKDPLLRVHVLQNRGQVAHELGDLQTAQQNYERAQSEAGDVADPRWYAGCLEAMGRLRLDLQDYDGAITYFMKSEAVFESVDNKRRAAEVMYRHANALLRLGNLNRAREIAEQAAGVATGVGHQSLNHLAQALALECRAQLGEDTREIERGLTAVVRSADALPDARTAARCRLALVRFLAGTDLVRAKAVGRETVKRLEILGGGALLADAYEELSRILAQHGLAEEAVTYSSKAYQILRSGGK